MKAKGRHKATPTATTPEEAFLQAIHANIADPAPWQMYADWLEERGDPNAILYRERRTTDAFGITFVTVPAGTFWMGGGGGQPGKEQRTVEAFQIGIYPVTQGQWEEIMGDNPCWCSRRGAGRDRIDKVSDDVLRTFPVEMVSWEDAQLYIMKLNGKDHGGGWRYRLPSEADWEYACRGGATSKEDCSFHFYVGEPSNGLSSRQANFDGNYPDGEGASGPYWKRTTKVGSYPPNRLGICDMHGNVWEWCADTGEGDPSRVFRGGCWFDYGNQCRASQQTGAGRPRRPPGLPPHPSSVGPLGAEPAYRLRSALKSL